MIVMGNLDHRSLRSFLEMFPVPASYRKLLPQSARCGLFYKPRAPVAELRNRVISWVLKKGLVLELPMECASLCPLEL